MPIPPFFPVMSSTPFVVLGHLVQQVRHSRCGRRRGSCPPLPPPATSPPPATPTAPWLPMEHRDRFYRPNDTVPRIRTLGISCPVNSTRSLFLTSNVRGARKTHQTSELTLVQQDDLNASPHIHDTRGTAGSRGNTTAGLQLHLLGDGLWQNRGGNTGRVNLFGRDRGLGTGEPGWANTWAIPPIVPSSFSIFLKTPPG